MLQLDIAVQTKYLDTGDEDEFVDAVTSVSKIFQILVLFHNHSMVTYFYFHIP